jgi:hypothetical protein
MIQIRKLLALKDLPVTWIAVRSDDRVKREVIAVRPENPGYFCAVR